MDNDVDQKFELHPPTIDSSNTNGVSSNNGGGKPSTAAAAGPIPMTMPSILRNKGIPQSNHLSHLLERSSHPSSSSYPPNRPSKQRPNTRELGRRKQRRSENAHLLSNPHAVRPTIKDYRLHSNEIKSTFHPTLPGSKPNAVPVPSNSRTGYSEPSHDANSANQGHFGKSLKDAQRVLKRLEVGAVGDDMIRENKGGELERFLWLVDREIKEWSTSDIHLFDPSSTPNNRKVGKVLLDENFQFTSTPFPNSSDPTSELPTIELDTITPGKEGGQLVEFQRTPNALVWLIHDPFLRLIVHCLARVSKCPSFSKDDANRPGLRFTWILNKNPLSRRTRRGRRVSVSSSVMSVDAAPNARLAEAGGEGGVGGLAPQMRALHLAAGGMDTPPTTDFDSQTETENETESEIGTDTDIEGESLAGSMVLPQPTVTHNNVRDSGEEVDEGVEAEAEGFEGNDEGEVVDTDEEEAEILRRVRRWAIESHRQRAEREAGEVGASEGQGQRKVGKTRSRLSKSALSKDGGEEEDPDQTLTGTTIAEEVDEVEDDDVQSHSSA